jgi:hypothetical protein
MALSSVNLFYSWFNVSSAFNNNSFSFTFTTGAGTATYNVTIPDGYYSVSDLNSYLQFFMINNGLYLVNGSGANIYYIELVENASQYALQLNCYPFPTALPAGWTNPAGLTFPAVASTPQLIVPNTGFSTWSGITSGTYPAVIQASTYSKISDTTPKTTPVESVLMRCNIIENRVSNPPDIIYSFSASGVGFGNLIQSSPYEYLYLDVADGYFSSLVIEFVDQQYRAIQINDSSVIIQLSFKTLKQNSL